MTKIMVFLGCIIIVFFISWIGNNILHSSAFGFGEGSQSSQTYLVIAAMTIFGVILSIIVSALKNMVPNQPIDINRLMHNIFVPQSMIALCVSPLVFYTFLVALGSTEPTFLTFFAALQNGFFWQQILKS
jgi:hypothetical protein